MSFKIEWKGSNVIVSFTKDFTYKDSYEVNNLIYGDLRYDTMKYQSADFSKIEKVEFTVLQARAAWNWEMLHVDGSHGVHNPAYTKALLGNTIDALKK